MSLQSMSEFEPGSSQSVGTRSLLLCPGCVTSPHDRSSCAVLSSSRTRTRTQEPTYGSELPLCLWDEHSLTGIELTLCACDGNARTGLQMPCGFSIRTQLLDHNYRNAWGTRSHLRVKILLCLLGEKPLAMSEVLLCLYFTISSPFLPAHEQGTLLPTESEILLCVYDVNVLRHMERELNFMARNSLTNLIREFTCRSENLLWF
jgi:hypothetical protein